jgi:hypothetical protein
VPLRLPRRGVPMTAPVPPGRVQAPPLTAAEAERVARFDAAPELDLTAEARQEAVARWLFERDYRERGLASPSDASWDEFVERNQDEWRDEARKLLAALAPADHEPAAAIQRVLALAEWCEQQAASCCDGEFCGAWDSCREARNAASAPDTTRRQQ